MSKKDLYIAELQNQLAKAERQLLEANAQRAFTYKTAFSDVLKCGEKHLLGSAAVIHITGIGGKELVPPVLITDGLSAATIEAIRADILRSDAHSFGGLYRLQPPAEGNAKK